MAMAAPTIDTNDQERGWPKGTWAERTVIGHCLIDNGTINVFADALKPEQFHHPQHRKVYAAVLELHAVHAPVDLISVSQVLEDAGELAGIGGRTYLAGMEEDVLTTVNPWWYCEKVLAAWREREARHIGLELYSGETDAPHASNRLGELAEQTERPESRPVPVAECVYEVGDTIDKRAAGIVASGLMTGYPKLDRLTTGFQPGNLIIIAGLSSVGKTAFAINIVRNMMERKIPGVFFSLEMTRAVFVERLIALFANVSMRHLRLAGEMSDEQKQKVANTLDSIAEVPLIIDDTRGLTTEQFRARARRLKAEVGIQWIVCDYIQLMRLSEIPHNANREVIVSELSKVLGQVAGDCRVPVLALSQVNQEGEVRESRAVFHDCDFMIRVERDVKKAMSSPPAQVGDDPEVCSIHVEKGKDVGTGKVPFLFYGATMRFFERPW